MIAHTSLVDHAVLTVVVVATFGVFARAWSARRHRSWSRLAAAAFAGATLIAATAPPFERVADRSFAWHMAQHLVLLAMAAPLVVVARPLTTVGEASAWARRVRTSRPAVLLRRSGAAARTLLALVILVVVHIGRTYDAALEHRLVHDAQHVAFLIAGCLMWSVSLEPAIRRAPERIAAAFASSAALTVLSVWLLALDGPLSNRYAERVGFDEALDDQRTGAALMWVGMISLTLPLLLVAVWQWASTEQRVAERAEALLDARGK